MLTILIIGCGDIGTSVAEEFIALGYHVTALKRNPPKSATIRYLKADITDVHSLAHIKDDFDQVLYILSPDSSSEAAYKAVFETGLNHALKQFKSSTFTFISSSVVYPQSKGECLDENAKTSAHNMRSTVILKAEKAILSHNNDNTIIRFSGIYGRGGNRILTKLKEEKAFQYAPPYYVNRIHKEDCVGVIVFIMRAQPKQQIYLASEENPLTLYALASLIAKEHNLPLPQKQYLKEDAPQNKRLLANKLIKLGYIFKHKSQ